jgi:hypothetical protein
VTALLESEHETLRKRGWLPRWRWTRQEATDFPTAGTVSYLLRGRRGRAVILAVESKPALDVIVARNGGGGHSSFPVLDLATALRVGESMVK